MGYDNIVTESLNSLKADLVWIISKVNPGRASLLLPAVLSAKIESHARPGTHS